MYFHIMVSTACNSQCRYCYKKGFEDFENHLNEKFNFDFDTPSEIAYDIKELKKFLEKSQNKEKNNIKEKTMITFYGGEPLLQIDKIKEIIDLLGKEKFSYAMQTNALLLDKIPSDYLNKFKIILVSLDGNKEATDFNRGAGTYDKVIENLKLIRKNKFHGEIVARMVVDEHNNLLESVKHLVSLIEQDLINSIHWQLDMGFYEFDFKKRNIPEFVKKYNKELADLIDYWITYMKENKKVLKIYPFLGIFETLLYNKKEKLRCGSGYANYTISTNGKISVCPIMHDSTTYQIGDINTSSPNKLKEVYVDGICLKCDIQDICGGRCLYANKGKLWPIDGERLICETIRYLIDKIKNKMPEIISLIDKGIVKQEYFEYEKYSGPEIIP